MNWVRVSFVLLVLMVATAFASSPPPQPCFFIPRHAMSAANVSGGAGGGGLDLSDAPFVTWDFNASLNNETPVWSLTRSVVPSVADNASLTIGNATNYFSSVHALNGFFLFVSVAQQFNALNATFSGNVTIAEGLSVTGNASASNVSAQRFTATDQSFVNAYESAGQTVYRNFETPINFTSEISDVRSEYDTTTGNFTAKTAGVYQITCKVELTSIFMSDSATVRIRVNSSAIADYPVLIPATAVLTRAYALNAGDDVFCAADLTFAINDAQVVAGNAVTYLSIVRLH